jgi:hypothetical protein
VTENYFMSTRTEAENTAAAAQTKAPPQGQTSHAKFECPPPPKIKTSAKDMAVYLERYADELRRIAEQLRAKKPNETIALQWPPCPIVMDCNGGGNGGGG